MVRRNMKYAREACFEGVRHSSPHRPDRSVDPLCGGRPGWGSPWLGVACATSPTDGGPGQRDLKGVAGARERGEKERECPERVRSHLCHNLPFDRSFLLYGRLALLRLDPTRPRQTLINCEFKRLNFPLVCNLCSKAERRFCRARQNVTKTKYPKLTQPRLTSPKLTKP